MSLARFLVPLLGLLSIVVVDIIRLRQWPLIVAGLLDELAHVLTALVVHAAIGLPRSKAALLGTLAGATLLDADHVPHHLGSRILTSDTERPLTHSAISVGLVACMAILGPRRWRLPLLCAAVGASTQLVRDVGTGSIPLWWPLSRKEVRLPYVAYLAFIALCALACMRSSRPKHAE